MTRTLMIFVALAVGLGATNALAGTVGLPDIGGGTITFDTAQFATGYGTLDTPVVSPGNALGYDLSDFARVGGQLPGSEFAALPLTFDGNLWNGTGTDLWIYEIGWVDDIELAINGKTFTFETTDTGALAPGTGHKVRLLEIDLDKFGLGSGDTGIDTITISTPRNGTDWYTPDIAAVAANLIMGGEQEPRVAVVPLPSSALMGLGLLAVALAGRALRRRRR